MVTTLPAIFQDSVARFGDRPALMHKEQGRYRSISYRDFARRVDSLAAFLVESGVGVGERVALLSENRPEWVVSDQALLAIGAVNVPVYPTLTPQQIQHILNDCGACMAIASSSAQLEKLLAIAPQVPSLRALMVMDPAGLGLSERVLSFHDSLESGEGAIERTEHERQARREALRADDLASIVYTSGTTGEPKGAMLTHGNFASNALSAAEVLDVNETDVELSFLPLSHVFERVVYYVAISRGVAIAYAESIEALPQNLVEVRPTFVCTVPRVLEKIYFRAMDKIEHEAPLKREVFWAALEIGEFYHKVMAEDGRVVFPTNVLYQAADKLAFKPIRDTLGGRLRFIISGAAPLAPEVGRFFQVAGIPVLEGYGLTESSPVLTLNPPEAPRFGTVGQPIEGVTVRLASDGEIIARGPNIMKGYWNNEEATREAIDADGWLHTGDIGAFDAQGYLAIVDRKKEILVMSNGKNVAPQPIENRLVMVPIIDQAMLIGDKRNYIGALIVPDLAVAEKIGHAAGLEWESPEELIASEPVRAAIDEAVAQENKGLAQFEQIKRWVAIAQPFTQEAGELTPTQKMKRRVILQHHAAKIDGLYQGAAEKVLVKA